MIGIEVRRLEPSLWEVRVVEGGDATVHRVGLADEDLDRYGAGVAAAVLLEESFRFLLEREPKEAILRRFDLPDIERYFPEYPAEIRRRLGTGPARL